MRRQRHPQPALALSRVVRKSCQQNGSPAPLGEEMLKTRLGSYGAAELLNQLQWDTYPEKILLLASWHEARGGRGSMEEFRHGDSL